MATERGGSILQLIHPARGQLSLAKCASKMATGRQTFVTVLFYSLCCVTFSVILRTTDKDVWANEFDSIELTCLIESISTNNPRIEWKKIKNGVPSYVYFQNKITGDLVNRALLREPANLLILNASRSDSAKYRCEVVAIDDHKPFDEILISLAVRVKPVVPRCSVPNSVTAGSSTELRCLESEGYPLSRYQWFRNNEELPEDPKTSIRFYNSSYVMNAETGSLGHGEHPREHGAQGVVHPGKGASPSQGTITYTLTHPFIHYGHFGHANQPTMHVFGLGEETGVLGGNPQHGENMQTPHTQGHGGNRTPNPGEIQNSEERRCRGVPLPGQK
ncbi:junctional adhesion molecule 3B isoform X1 [Ictalurus furcatus]|uniref:junctional adhesion molecule 3B isoform X1 n=1 Tax=Ictalurus furcatus TaxID=66913 RepID=UPI00234FE762|nr:junctional adhesion molecule 3B isoform X1 [Ictalurus furcatus]